MRSRLRAAGLLALALALPACGSDDDEGTQPPARAAPAATAVEGTLVGKVAGTEAYIALNSDGERLGGYVCDGTRQRVTTSLWLAAPPDEDGKGESGNRRGQVAGGAASERGWGPGTIGAGGA